MRYLGRVRSSRPTVSLSLAQRPPAIEKPEITGFLRIRQEMASLLNRPPPKP
jgi:hypothetical protein